MRKLSRFIKPYAWLFIAALALLFVQAMSDLNLPNLMADIVDIGLQNNGIESVIPEAISKDGLDFIGIFMSEEEKSLLESSYQAGSTSTLKERNDFSNIVLDEAMFLKQELKDNEENNKSLEDAFGNASWTLIYYLQDNVEQEEAPKTGEESTAMDMDVSKIDIKSMYALSPQFLQMKAAGVLDEYIEKSAATPEMMKEQSAVKFSQMFYTELGADMEIMQRNYVLKTGIKMIVVTIISVSAAIFIAQISSRLGSSISHDIRNSLFEKIESFSLEEYSRFSSSSFITRIINDVRMITQLIIMGVRMLFYSPIMVIGGVIMILQTNVSMIWILLIPVAILIFVFFMVYKIGMPKFEKQQKIIDEINQVSREGLSGMMVVRAFGNEQFEEGRFDKVNEESRTLDLFVERLISVIFPVVMVIMNLTTVLIIWIGSNQIASSTLQVGDMIAFIQYAMQILFSFLSIAMMFVFIPRAKVSADRINEVLDEELVIITPENPKNMKEDKKGWVEFENVTFSYTGAEVPVLSNISFTAKPGEMVAFIGSTGSGKSTIINLIPRLYDVTEGSVKVGGVDVREQDLITLRDNIGYVAQENVLLSGSIDSNLRYGRQDASKEDIDKAIEVSQAEEFMVNLGEGALEHRITQGATNVSGGQRQRLSIARALTKQAPVYIFDDSFSALDFKTDASLRRALSKYAKNSSMLIVGQRVSSIMAADQIIVLENGEMVGIGTHKELLQTCPTYREIAESQLQEEEL